MTVTLMYLLLGYEFRVNSEGFKQHWPSSPGSISFYRS